MNHSHSQTHQEFQYILEAALDQALDAETQAALDQHLAECDECRRYAARMQKLDTRLGKSLAQRWPAAPLADGQRASIPGNILSRSRRTPMQNRISATARLLAFGTLAILMIVALGWGIRTLRPSPSPAGGGGTPAVPSGQLLPTPTDSSLVTAPRSSCPQPSGWTTIDVQLGDTLENLAQTYHATVEALVQANCLVTGDLIPGTILYVPGLPPTETSVPCGPPSDWVPYTTQTGDTLSHISRVFGVSIAGLQHANCLGSSTLLRAGQRIYVPNGPAPSPATSAEETPSTPTASAWSGESMAGSVGVFPKVKFTFNADIPAVPDQVTIYQQQFSEPATAELARQAAARLGVEGQVVEYTGEGGGTIYEVHGGGSVVRFLYDADQFVYEVTSDTGSGDPKQFLPFDQEVTIAEGFLRQKGLLDGSYRYEPVQGGPNVVNFVQLLDEREVRYGVGVNTGAPQWIEVSLTANGTVSTVIYNAHQFQSAGQYPVLSAQQAWNRFSGNSAGNYGMYAVLSAEKQSTYRSWKRDYPAGPVHIYDYTSDLQSAEGGSPLIQFSRYPLTGAYQDMPAGKFLHVWGQIVLDEAGGGKTFKVEGWELSTLEYNFLSGTIQRQGDTATLHTDDGRWLPLLGLPADVPDGGYVNVAGVILNGSLDWSFIDMGEPPRYYGSILSCGGGGGGGSTEVPDRDFGGVSLARLKMADNQSAPAQPVPPYKAGDVLNGQVGTAWVTINQYADRTEVEAAMWVETADGTTFVAHLSGAGLSGIEQFNALPIKVWGRVDRADSSEMYFTVDRFEAAYPGEKLQAWIGTDESVTLEGKNVLLFTTLDGQQFVLKNSIVYGDSVRIGRPGDTVIHEGVLIPEMTFGGYPVIDERAGSMANGRTDLSGYTILSGPSVIDHTQEVPVVSPASVLEGNVTIDQAELVYLAYSLAGCPAGFGTSNPEAMYLQPVWRFRGTFENGRQFEVLVQALPDADLTFTMP